jgi:hypothetical protein
MDRERVREEVDIARGIADTVAMLENKSRSKPVRLRIETAEDCPRSTASAASSIRSWKS